MVNVSSVLYTIEHLSSLPPLSLSLPSLSLSPFLLQRRQLDILLNGFLKGTEKGELAALLVDDKCLEMLDSYNDEYLKQVWTGSTHSHTLFELCSRMVKYIETGSVSDLSRSTVHGTTYCLC